MITEAAVRIGLIPGAATRLCNDCDRDAVARLRPMYPVADSQPLGAAAGRHLPTTYVR